MNKIITSQMMKSFEYYLKSDEKSDNTIQKYMRDVKVFYSFAKDQEVDKALVLEYKSALMESHAICKC